MTDVAHDSRGSDGDSAQVLPKQSHSDELGTCGRNVAGAVREARAELTGRAFNALTVGDTSKRLQAALEPLRSEIYHATLSDLGLSENGPQRPTEALRMTARNLAALDVLGETFWAYIAGRPFTSKGKTRSAVNTWLAIVDRQTKLAAVIGLERKARDVSRMSAEEFLQSRGAR